MLSDIDDDLPPTPAPAKKSLKRVSYSKKHSDGTRNSDNNHKKEYEDEDEDDDDDYDEMFPSQLLERKQRILEQKDGKKKISKTNSSISKSNTSKTKINEIDLNQSFDLGSDGDDFWLAKPINSSKNKQATSTVHHNSDSSQNTKKKKLSSKPKEHIVSTDSQSEHTDLSDNDVSDDISDHEDHSSKKRKSSFSIPQNEPEKKAKTSKGKVTVNGKGKGKGKEKEKGKVKEKEKVNSKIQKIPHKKQSSKILVDESDTEDTRKTSKIKTVKAIPKQNVKPKTKIKATPKQKTVSKSQPESKQNFESKSTKTKPATKAAIKSSKTNDEESSFSLFDILDIDNNNDNNEGANGDDEKVFILASPVKPKKRRAKTKTKSKSVEEDEDDESDDNSNNNKRKSSLILENEIKNQNKNKRRQKEKEEKNKQLREQQKQQEQELELLELKESLRNEKLKEQQRIEEEEMNRQIKLQNELKQKKLRIIEKQNRLKLLKQLKESTSKIMNDVETVTIPLKDSFTSNSANTLTNSRRSSLASRGRRLSSVGNGFTGIPHESIPNDQLYKHVDISLPDSYKLKQLIIWLSKRFIENLRKNGKLRGNNENEDDLQGDRCNEGENMDKIGMDFFEVILSKFIKNLIEGRVEVDWWGNDDSNNNSLNNNEKPIIVHKNKENIENLKKLKFYENEIKKLKREEKIWDEINLKFNSNNDSNVNEFQNAIDINSKNIPKINSKDYDVKVDDDLINLIELSKQRINKFDNLLFRLDSTNSLLQRLIDQKNSFVATNIRKDCEIDAVKVLQTWNKL